MTIVGMLLLIVVASNYNCNIDTIMIVAAIMWLAVVVDIKGGSG